MVFESELNYPLCPPHCQRHLDRYPFDSPFPPEISQVTQARPPSPLDEYRPSLLALSPNVAQERIVALPVILRVLASEQSHSYKNNLN